MGARRSFARAVAVLGALLTVASLGVVPASGIANGTAATAGQFPYAVQLRLDDIKRPNGTTYDSACSGVLISRTWIMTAGHCFHDGNRTRVSGAPRYATTARLGTVSTADPRAGVTRTVVWVEQSRTNDMALARLNAPVDGIAPARLNTRTPVVGQVLTFAGWGATTSAGAPSERLFWGQVRVNAVRSSTVLMTGYRPSATTSACPYDSGAPYVGISSNGTATLVSVESTGPACPHRLPETTARVDTAVPWIRGIVTDLPR
ncbi:MAG TPA: trypsin-like serine protease [Nocardioides sp.]|nr:trypsin-like serine protease [Nocardioides sp.]